MELLLYNVVDARALDDRIESVHFLRGKGTAANRICPAERLIFASAQRIEVQKLIADPGRARGKIAGDGVQILCVCRIAGDKRRAYKDVRTAVAEQLKLRRIGALSTPSTALCRTGSKSLISIRKWSVTGIRRRTVSSEA